MRCRIEHWSNWTENIDKPTLVTIIESEFHHSILNNANEFLECLFAFCNSGSGKELPGHLAPSMASKDLVIIHDLDQPLIAPSVFRCEPAGWTCIQ